MKSRLAALCAVACLVMSAGVLLAADSPAESVLISKGLTKVGFYYLVDEDVKFHDQLRTLRMSKNQMESGESKRTQLEKKIKTIDTAMQNGLERDRELNAALSGEQSNPVEYNNTIDQINELRAQMRSAMALGQQTRAEEAKLPDPRDAYIEAVLTLSDSMEAAVVKYDALSTDPDVKSALQTINATARVKMRLGPSGDFSDNLASIRQQRANVNSAAIKFNNDNGTPRVDVVLNGKLTVPMVMDSGASVVCLSWDTALQLGLTPAPSDPKMKFAIADGSIVEASMMHLKSVRLGQFEVQDVLCSVAPRSAQDTPNLLGGTFLRNFVYRMDLAAGVVHMSQLAVKTPADTKDAQSSPNPDSVRDSAPGARKLGANEVAVSAIRTQKNPFATGILLKQGETFAIEPNVDDTWSKGAGPHAGKKSDYRGYADRPGLLAMKWKIGNSIGTVVFDQVETAPADGELYLFCSDASPAQNEGSIRATVNLKPQAAPADAQ